MQRNKSLLYSGLVWVFSAIALLLYAGIGLFNAEIPGVEQLVEFIKDLDGRYVYLAGFLAIFIEGLYFVGSFFPGSTLVLVVGVLSQTSGLEVWFGTIVAIFCGWTLAGAVNIYMAQKYRSKMLRPESDEDYKVQDKLWATWYPAFRANHEVAQITEGGAPWKVFLSSVRVKFFASIFAAIITLLTPLLIDINEVQNSDGFITIIIVAGISLIVGAVKIKKYKETS